VDGGQGFVSGTETMEGERAAAGEVELLLGAMYSREMEEGRHGKLGCRGLLAMERGRRGRWSRLEQREYGVQGARRHGEREEIPAAGAIGEACLGAGHGGASAAPGKMGSTPWLLEKSGRHPREEGGARAHGVGELGDPEVSACWRRQQGGGARCWAARQPWRRAEKVVANGGAGASARSQGASAPVRTKQRRSCA
jgi:hypothetical protein